MNAGDGDENWAMNRSYGTVPMKRPGQDQIVIYGEFVEGGVEVALKNEAASFINDYEGVDDPVGGQQWLV